MVSEQKGSSISSSTVISLKVGKGHQHFLIFSFNFFATTMCQSPTIEFELISHLKKNRFFCHSYENEVTITSQLEFSIFSNMATSTTLFKSHDKILLWMAWTEIMKSYPFF